mgnify:CR=1 FL=1
MLLLSSRVGRGRGAMKVRGEVSLKAGRERGGGLEGGGRTQGKAQEKAWTPMEC